MNKILTVIFGMSLMSFVTFLVPAFVDNVVIDKNAIIDTKWHLKG